MQSLLGVDIVVWGAADVLQDDMNCATLVSQVIPIFVSMMAASGGQSAPANAATGPTSNQQQGGASGAQQFMIPGLSMGPENQVCAFCPNQYHRMPDPYTCCEMLFL